MKDIERHIYGADLRDHLIPCGECGFEDAMSNVDLENIKRDVRRLDTELDGHEQENARTITELATTVKHISTVLDNQARIMEGLERRFGEMERKLDRYNNLRERTDALERSREKLSTDYVPRQEFNGAINALRGEIRTMKWIFGIGFTAVAGLLTGVIILLIGG